MARTKDLTRAEPATVTQSEADLERLRQLRKKFIGTQFDLLAIGREIETLTGRIDPGLTPILEELSLLQIALSRPFAKDRPRDLTETRILATARLANLAAQLEETITSAQLRTMLRRHGAPEDIALLLDGTPEPIPDHELAAPATAVEERTVCLEPLGHLPPPGSRRH